MSLERLYQSGDWKGEKHVPYIEILKIEEKEITVYVCIGKEIPHPNTLEHHIAYIELYFHGDNDKFPVMISRTEFRAHGEYNTFTKPETTARFKIEKSGTLYAKAYCNIHGLWINSIRINL